MQIEGVTSASLREYLFIAPCSTALVSLGHTFITGAIILLYILLSVFDLSIKIDVL